jgi:pimeloyl-ACP methyl ester carboxylesterase
MSITSFGRNLIHYEALGRGEPLIFLHGWLGSWRYWWPTMHEMSRYYRTFAFDLWGFGDSSKPENLYQFESYVEMLDVFIENLGITRPVTLVGHGLGAIVALRYATNSQSPIKRLVTVSLPVRGNDINRRLLKSNAQSFYDHITRRVDNYPEVQQELRKTDPVVVQRVTQQLLQADFTGDVQSLVCPLLMVSGEKDPVVKEPTGEAAHLLNPAENRVFVSFEACNHFPMLDERAKFSRLILEFAQTNSENLAYLSPKDYWQRRTY